MNTFFNIMFCAVLALLALVGYWYAYPDQVPRALRNMMPELSAPSPKSPVGNFRPPTF